MRRFGVLGVMLLAPLVGCVGGEAVEESAATESTRAEVPPRPGVEQVEESSGLEVPVVDDAAAPTARAFADAVRPVLAWLSGLELGHGVTEHRADWCGTGTVRVTVMSDSWAVSWDECEAGSDAGSLIVTLGSTGRVERVGGRWALGEWSCEISIKENVANRRDCTLDR